MSVHTEGMIDAHKHGQADSFLRAMTEETSLPSADARLAAVPRRRVEFMGLRDDAFRMEMLGLHQVALSLVDPGYEVAVAGLPATLLSATARRRRSLPNAIALAPVGQCVEPRPGAPD